MTIALVDTTILCNVLQVPGMDQDSQTVLEQLAEYIQSQVVLLLPVATILETGNHIAQLDSGDRRRMTAARLVEQVKLALDRAAPWTVPQPLLDAAALRQYLDEFPDHAMRGVSLGDVSIIKEFERQCALHQARRVFIWSLDGHLVAYDRTPGICGGVP